MPRLILSRLRIHHWLLWSSLSSLGLVAEVHFSFPTANRALLQADGDAAFFVGTPGKPWTSGSFGCVRSQGYQFHEGADIRSVQRDKRNEPTDPVLATANGWIVYVNRKSGLSNYGKYVVIGHKIEGLEIYSIYAHLSLIQPHWKPGKWIESGQQVGVMGRTSNTRQRISKERAHLHFELALLMNHQFPTYFKKLYPKGKNDHGIWNGQNLAGIDPAAVFREQEEAPERFSLRSFLREKTPLFKVTVAKTEFPWATRYVPLILRAPELSSDQINGYEISFDYSGLPYQLKPVHLDAPNLKEPYQLSQVDEAIYREHPCRKLVIKTGQKWKLTAKGRQALDLLLYSKN